jgi:hypothetical protein
MAFLGIKILVNPLVHLGDLASLKVIGALIASGVVAPLSAGTQDAASGHDGG